MSNKRKSRSHKSKPIKDVQIASQDLQKGLKEGLEMPKAPKKSGRKSELPGIT